MRFFFLHTPNKNSEYTISWMDFLPSNCGVDYSEAHFILMPPNGWFWVNPLENQFHLIARGKIFYVWASNIMKHLLSYYDDDMSSHSWNNWVGCVIETCFKSYFSFKIISESSTFQFSNLGQLEYLAIFRTYRFLKF